MRHDERVAREAQLLDAAVDCSHVRFYYWSSFTRKPVSMRVLLNGAMLRMNGILETSMHLKKSDRFVLSSMFALNCSQVIAASLPLISSTSDVSRHLRNVSLRYHSC